MSTAAGGVRSRGRDRDGAEEAVAGDGADDRVDEGEGAQVARVEGGADQVDEVRVGQDRVPEVPSWTRASTEGRCGRRLGGLVVLLRQLLGPELAELSERCRLVVVVVAQVEVRVKVEVVAGPVVRVGVALERVPRVAVVVAHVRLRAWEREEGRSARVEVGGGAGCGRARDAPFECGWGGCESERVRE